MSGCRHLSHQEVNDIINNMTGTFTLRNRALFQLGVETGYRISELLSLSFGDVFDNDRVCDRVSICRDNMKGKRVGRGNIMMGNLSKKRLMLWKEEAEKRESKHGIDSADPIFFSRKRDDNDRLQSITAVQAWRAFKKAIKAAGIDGKVGTHSMRKTAGVRFYKESGQDLKATQIFLGHSSVNDTMRYLSDCLVDIDGISKNMHERYENMATAM